MLTAQIQKLIDQHVADSPRARALLAQLDGRRMQIVARYTPWRVTLWSHEARLLLARDALQPGQDQDPEPDVIITGSPLALLALLREEPAAVMRRGDVTMKGDSDLGSRFQELLQLLKPDLEALLARAVGDIPAYGAGTLLRKALDYGRSSLRTQATNLGEYLAHERQVLVPRAEADNYLHEVDALREQTDRLAARVAALEAARGAP